MVTLKETIYNILLNNPDTRNSRALLKWELMKKEGFVENHDWGDVLIMEKKDFIKWETDTVRRCSQQIQREDLLLGKNLVQPTKEIKEKRVKLSKEKGFSYIQGKQLVFNIETQTYEYT